MPAALIASALVTALVLGINGPFDLRRSMRALGAGRLARDGTAWYAASTDSGPGTLLFERDTSGVAVSRWGAGGEELLDDVGRILGLDDEPDDFDPGTGLLRDLHSRARGLRLGSTGRLFDMIVPTVIGQLVTTKEAKASYARLVRSLGTPAPGPNETLRIPPAPSALATLGYEDLHRLGIERKRAQTLIECARRAKRIEEAATMDGEAARKRLLAIRGVGPWTTESVMGGGYGDRDAIPPGDHNRPHLISWALAGEPRGDDARMFELLEAFRPNRRRALMLVKQSGIHAPRYGPKTAIRTHL